MRFDWTVHFGDVATLLPVIVGLIYGLRFVGKVETWVQEFPPHRHFKGAIFYPKGLSPDDYDKADTRPYSIPPNGMRHS